ncbi:MAG: GNAT family N-acetyltransferase [Brevefilum sp.]
MNQEHVNIIEEASLNAWPAKEQMLFDNWVLRLTGGPSKRVNSVTVRGMSSLPLEKKVAFCDQIFQRKELPLIFRIPEPLVTIELSNCLEDLDFHSFDPTLVMGREVDEGQDLKKGLDIRQMSPVDWLAARSWLIGLPLTALGYHAEILNLILPEKTLICLFEDGQPAACGMAVIQADLLGYFSIYTRHTARRRGYARAVMAALSNWGRERGAVFGYLQVEGHNQTAKAMYERLGFEQVYTYKYMKREFKWNDQRQ